VQAIAPGELEEVADVALEPGRPRDCEGWSLGRLNGPGRHQVGQPEGVVGMLMGDHCRLQVADMVAGAVHQDVKRRAGVDHYPAVEDVGRVERVTGKCGAGAEEGQLHQARRVLGFITPAGSNISWIRPR